MNRFYGTSLQDDDIKVEMLPRWMTAPADASPVPLALLKKQRLLFRAATTVAPRYDVLVTANNEVDFGRPGIQYVHYPSQKSRRGRPRTCIGGKGLAAVVNVYYRLGESNLPVHGRRDEAQPHAGELQLDGASHAGGARSGRAHPVPPGHRDVRRGAGAHRQNGFMCVGRIAPEKAIDRIIDIVSAARERCGPLTLCIVGTPGPRQYRERIRARVAASGGWISHRETVSREELLALMRSYRYGIHGRLEEHFGIAPAEMAAAGSIVFVPNGGGQVEIVNGDPRLVYDSIEGAVSAIARVVENPDLQAALRRMLSARSQMFAVERFITEFRTLVEQFPAN